MSKTLAFSKMHGLGNDFMVIDAVRQQIEPTPAQIRKWSDRHTGVGFDQLLLVQASDTPEALFRYRIFNANGSEVEHCGNGARCFARFVTEKGLCSATTIPVATCNGRIELELEGDAVRVDMGQPRFAPQCSAFDAASAADHYEIETEQGRHSIGVVSMGNPHAVLQVDDVETAPVSTLGPLIEQHPRFAQGVNVGFLQIIDRQQGRLRVWERDVGETQACGTGACAAMAVGVRWGVFDHHVDLQLRGGQLGLQWQGAALTMRGAASFVYDGTIDL